MNSSAQSKDRIASNSSANMYVSPTASGSLDLFNDSNLSVYRLCLACGQPMNGQFIHALEAAFHLNCFKCLVCVLPGFLYTIVIQMVMVDHIFSQDCGAVIASKFFPINSPDGKQQPLCERDYLHQLDLICAKCNSPLWGSYVSACSEYLCQITLTFTAYMAIRSKVPPQTSYMHHLHNTVWPRRFILWTQWGGLLLFSLFYSVHK